MFSASLGVITSAKLKLPSQIYLLLISNQLHILYYLNAITFIDIILWLNLYSLFWSIFNVNLKIICSFQTLGIVLKFVNCYFCSAAHSCPTLCDPTDRSTPGLPVPHHLLRFAQVHVHCIGEAVQPAHPLMLSSPSALSLSQHQGLSQWVFHSHQMTKILELQLQHQSFQWIFRKIDCFDLLAVQGTFRSVIQHHSTKASILWHSSFFTVQLSQLYVTTGKTIALTTWTFVCRAVSLLLNTLSRFVIASRPRSNHLLISDFMAVVTIRSDFEEEICHYFHLSPLNLPCSNGAGYYDLSCFLFFNI